MYKKIILPLDGSELAECSLEHAKAVALGCNVAEVVLLRVVEPLSAETVAALAQGGNDLLRKAELGNQQEAESYVEKVSESLKTEGVSCRTIVTDGKAADEILDYSEKNNIDLIVMSTHGRSGISRWFSGSVAEKIVRHSAIPILLVSPAGCRNESS